MSSPPRPILKHTHSSPGSPRSVHHHAVHFPPSPRLTRTFSAYSPSTYDRSPIVVSQNSCALPERGCPGRTYTLDEAGVPPRPNLFRGTPHNGRVLHPRALAFNSTAWSLPNGRDSDDGQEDAQCTPTRMMPALPPLIPDLSSESDESDSFSYSPETFYPSIPSPASSSYVTKARHASSTNPGLHNNYDSYSSFDIFNGPTTPTALSFLPHPPSSPSHDDDGQKIRRRRERRRERSRSRSRERDSVRQLRDEVDCSIPSTPRKSRSGPCKTSPIPKRVSSYTFEDPDIGCLGGF